MEMYTFNIGAASNASGVSAKMIRHYEEIGLIPKARRSQSGYRKYSERDIHELRFIRQARNLGFSTGQIDNLLKLWRDHRRSSARVKELALDHVRELERKIEEMHVMKSVLNHLAMHCHGDDRPDCPILDQLASTDAGPRAAHRHVLKNAKGLRRRHAPRRSGQSDR